MCRSTEAWKWPGVSGELQIVGLNLRVYVRKTKKEAEAKAYRHCGAPMKQKSGILLQTDDSVYMQRIIIPFVQDTTLLRIQFTKIICVAIWRCTILPVFIEEGSSFHHPRCIHLKTQRYGGVLMNITSERTHKLNIEAKKHALSSLNWQR